MRKLWFLGLIVFATQVTAQKLPKATKELIQYIENQYVVLSEYKKEPLNNNNDYAKKVTDHIVTEWNKYALKPLNGNSFLIPFEIKEGRQIENLTSFLVNGQVLSLMDDYYPLIYSANAKEESYPNLAIKESGVPWFVDIHEIIEANNSDESSPNYLNKIHAAIVDLAQKVHKKGATCLVIHENAAKQDLNLLDGLDAIAPVDIPIVFIKHKAWEKYFTDQQGSYEISYNVKIGPKIRAENNLTGIINNNAPKTLVFSSNYDLFNRTNSTMIMLALANQLQLKQLNKFNYVFVYTAADNNFDAIENTLLDRMPNKEKDISCRIHIGPMNKFEHNTFYVMQGGTNSDWSKYFTTNKKDLYSIEFKATDSIHTTDFNGTYPMFYCFDGVNNTNDSNIAHTASIVPETPGKIEATSLSNIISKLVDILTKGQALSN